MRSFIVLLLITSFSCASQTPVISMTNYENDDDIELTDGCYVKDVENKYAPFLGIWEWVEGNNVLTIIVEKVELVNRPHSNHFRDYLVGKYKYVENGVEIINTLDCNITSTNMWDGATVPFYTSGYYSDTELIFDFIDIINEKFSNSSIELINPLEVPGGGIIATEAHWRISNKEQKMINNLPNISEGFSIPTDVVLTKQ
ncbi:DUF6705 family protein [Hanstruepera marina]|uniref:DUF6705 family protein n=1 Tax=Hanstruepera marina TaxID=2873265 RepID=UPI001CA74A95|nr:DUF6705 family protein [Hanstruepera marina]